MMILSNVVFVGFFCVLNRSNPLADSGSRPRGSRTVNREKKIRVFLKECRIGFVFFGHDI